MFDLRLSPVAAGRLLFAMFAVLLFAHLAVVVLRIEFDRDYIFGLALRFDFDRSVSVPDWFSGTLFLSAALASFLCAAAASKFERGQQYYWQVIGAIFIFLSFDEVAAIHTPMEAWLLDGGATIFGAWTNIYIPLVAILGLWLLPFLRRLPLSTAVILVIAGAMLVFGALGFEILGARIAEQSSSTPIAEMTKDQWVLVRKTWPYAIEATLEESLEMCGSILFVVAALGYLSRRGFEFRFVF